MKAQILKIAGVKSEKEFYKKYPTEEAFMKAHKKEFKKAQVGIQMQGVGQMANDALSRIKQGTSVNEQMFANPYVSQDAIGSIYAERQSTSLDDMDKQRKEFESYSNILDEYNKSQAPKPKSGGSGQQSGGGGKGTLNPITKAMNTVGDVVQGIQQLKEEKRARRRAEQSKGVSEVTLQASRTRDVDANREARRYVRPEDQRITGEEMFPIYGVGTNVLTAKDGVEANSKSSVPILSLVDYMKASGRNSSMKGRKELADRVGLKNYTGKADENKSLLKNLMNEDERVRSIYDTERIVNPETGNIDFEETHVYEEPMEVQQSRADDIRKAYKELQDAMLSSAVKKSIDKRKGVQPVAENSIQYMPYKGPTENEDFFTFSNRVYRSANPTVPIIDSRPDDRKLNMFEVMQNKLDAGAYDPDAASMVLRDNPNNPLNALLAFGANTAAEWPLRLGISAGKLFTGKGEARDAVTLGSLGVGPAVSRLASKLPAFGRLIRMKSLNPMSRNVGNPMFEEPTLENLFSGANRFMPSVKKVAAQFKYDMNKLAQAAKTDKKLAKLLQEAAEEEEILMGVGTKMKPGTMPFDKFNKRAQENLNDLYERNYSGGGEIPKAFPGAAIVGKATGISKMLGMNSNITMKDLGDAGVADFASNMMTSIGGENAGGNIGRSIGKNFGPAGQFAGEAIGRLLNTNPQRIKKANEATMNNMGAMALNNGIQRAQIQNSSFMEDGGNVSPYEWVSHTWQPQVIASFGGNKMSDLLRPDRTMDTLRSGGHLKEYTDPSEEAMSTERPDFAFGGELQTHWGGYAEPMSYNPYMPGGGETVMFRGQSHDESDGKGRTGIGVTYGENPVEVERGEPAIKMKDGGEAGGDNMVVFGNLKIPHQLLEDKDAKGKNFKNYISKISKQEEKLNTSIEKNSNLLSSLDDSSPFGKLKFNSYKANVYGGNEKLKIAADKKMDAAALQSAMNDTIEEYGLKTSDRGIISARQGIKMAQNGTDEDGKRVSPEVYEELMRLYKRAENASKNNEKNEYTREFQRKFHELAPGVAEEVVGKYNVTAYGKEKGLTDKMKANEDNIFGKRTKQYIAALQKRAPKRKPEETIPTPRTMPTLKPPPDILTKGPMELKAPKREEEKDNVPFLKNIFDQVLPYLRPSDAEPLDPNQLYGEMNALASNQLEPVRAQTFQPELGVPYDISYQDMLNQNQADYRAQQRMAGYNPAAQSILNAQKYGANEKVLGEQFRANQAMKDRVYGENRNILNQAKLQNLGILDNQYVRQEQAKSNTKAVKQAALDSISAKYAQNKLENRTLQTYENQYNYRYDNKFRAMNMNAPDPFNLSGLTPVIDEQGNVVQYIRNTVKKDKYGRPEGSSTTTTIKKKNNGGIVKALKSI